VPGMGKPKSTKPAVDAAIAVAVSAYVEAERYAVLTAEIPQGLKREVKLHSALRGETIKQVVTRALRREMAGWDS
jgi:hypothetical protein